jgi:hypothetical protein
VGCGDGGAHHAAGAQLLVFKSVEDARPASSLPLRGACAAPLKALRRHAFQLHANGLAPQTGSRTLRAGRQQGTEAGAGIEAFARGVHRQGAFAAETVSELHAWLAEIRGQIARADADADDADADADADAAEAEERAATRVATLRRDHGAHRAAAPRRSTAARRAVGVLTVRQALADAAAADPAHTAANAADAADAADAAGTDAAHQRGRRGSHSSASPAAAAAPRQVWQHQHQHQHQQRCGKISNGSRPSAGALQSLRPADVNARASGEGEQPASKSVSKPTSKPTSKLASRAGPQPCAHEELQGRQAADAVHAADAARKRYERNTPRKQARDAQRAQLLALECAALVNEEGWTPPPSPRELQGERRRGAVPGAVPGADPSAVPGAASGVRGGALSRLRATLRRCTSSFAVAQAS